MRMNRRAFSQAAAAAQPAPGGQYTVYLWNMSMEEPFYSDDFPDGVYGVYSAGEVVEVDMSGVREVSTISNVNPYVTGSGDSVECEWIDVVCVRFVMPAFDVAVEVETLW